MQGPWAVGSLRMGSANPVNGGHPILAASSHSSVGLRRMGETLLLRLHVRRPTDTLLAVDDVRHAHWAAQVDMAGDPSRSTGGRYGRGSTRGSRTAHPAAGKAREPPDEKPHQCGEMLPEAHVSSARADSSKSGYGKKVCITPPAGTPRTRTPPALPGATTGSRRRKRGTGPACRHTALRTARSSRERPRRALPP